MSSTDRLGALRKRNKDLLLQLKQQTERLQSLSGTKGFTEGADANTTAQENAIKVSANGITLQVNTVPLLPHEEDAESMVVTLVGGDRGPARTALCKPTMHFNERVTTEIQATSLLRSGDEAGGSVTGTMCTTSTPSLTGARQEHGQAEADHSEYSRQLRDRGNGRPAIHVRSMDVRRASTRPIICTQQRGRREVGKVTFHSPGQEQMSASNRHHVQPLLGYDWIAGLLEAESSMTERSEEFFSDLRTFRQVNRDECVHSQQEGLVEENFSPPPLSINEEDTVDTMDTHQCTFCYRINSRLFPTPLDSQESCPVCKMPKSKHPHTAADPAFIRVSIPRSTLLPAYLYKAHRRCSFDPSDSLGLPSHCLSGMSNKAQSGVSQPSSLDLRSALRTAPPTGLPPAQPHTKGQLDLSVSRVSGSQRSDQLLNVSRLARYRFQRPAPNSNPPSSSYPVY